MSAESPFAPTPATAERLARALDGLLGTNTGLQYHGDIANHIWREDCEACVAVDEARAALAAYTAEGGKL